jgi:hypothetical protein
VSEGLTQTIIRRFYIAKGSCRIKGRLKSIVQQKQPSQDPTLIVLLLITVVVFCIVLVSLLLLQFHFELDGIRAVSSNYIVISTVFLGVTFAALSIKQREFSKVKKLTNYTLAVSFLCTSFSLVTLYLSYFQESDSQGVLSPLPYTFFLISSFLMALSLISIFLTAHIITGND